MDSTRTMTQCMPLHVPDRVFQTVLMGGGRRIPQSGLLLREFNLYGVGNLRKSDFDHLNLF